MQNQLLLFLLSISATTFGMITVTVDDTIYSPQEVTCKILLEKPNPQMIAWYIGESGLTKDGAHFYQECIFDKFKEVQQPHRFHLYDLVAWQGLRNKKASIQSKSKMAQHIDSLKNPHYSSIYSADFLKDILSEQDEAVVRYIKDVVLRNPHLYLHSMERKETGIKLKEVLPAQALEPIHDLDTAHAYSVLQYLEGIFLTKQVVLASQEKNINIVFFLPNDEYKYYVTKQIEQDMKTLLAGKIPADTTINATFNCFRFGQSIADRPYILRGKKATKKDLDDLFK